MRRLFALKGMLVLLLAMALLGLSLVPVSASPESTDTVVHVVQWGETLQIIARRYGTTYSVIASANNLANPNFVYAGQMLVIPAGAAAPAAESTGVYVVSRGDTLRSVAARYGTTVNYLVSLNALLNPDFIWVGQSLKVPSSSATVQPQDQGSTVVHIVQRGEFLARIAWKYGTTSSAIASANNLVNPSLIYVGQRLIIPAAGSSPPATSTPSVTPTSPGSTGEKLIDVNLSTQTLLAYEGTQVVYTARVSTGVSWYPTPAGTFYIQRKYRYDDMTGGSYARGDY